MIVSAIALMALIQTPKTTAPAPKVEIKELLEGKGLVAQAGDLVSVDYTGKLTNGKVFDSSKGPDKKPYQFVLGWERVIKGWDQGLVGLKIGGKRLLTIPPELGYGSEAQGDDIPANSILVFEVELKDIKRTKIEVLTKGTGEAAAMGDKVEVNYRGTMLDGTEFDSSYKRNQTFPVEIGVTRVITGFTQGLIGMKVGEKRKVTIPPEMAYGPRARSEIIKPNSTLVFELEVMKLEKVKKEKDKP